MTRKGKCSKRQHKKIIQKWYDDIFGIKKYAELSKKEFNYAWKNWPYFLDWDWRWQNGI